MCHLSNYIVIITPKNILNTSSYKTTRDFLKNKKIDLIIDFGETGFKGVLIETVCLFINNNKKPKNVLIKSLGKNLEIEQEQYYIMEDKLPYWIIYRDAYFDSIFNKMQFDIFEVFRDRQLTNSNTKIINRKDIKDNELDFIRVLKSRNISDNGKDIIDIKNYDAYIDFKELAKYNVSKFLNKDNIYIVPNMTYNTRMGILPKNTVTNGSIAILELKNENCYIEKEDMEFYSTKEFRTFYSIARNYQTRSLNVDNLSVFWYGKKKDKS